MSIDPFDIESLRADPYFHDGIDPRYRPRRDVPRFYLAGRIEDPGWRHEVVAGLRDAYGTDQLGRRDPWPILEGAVCGLFDYVGPYFVSDDHSCAHGTGTHGTTDDVCIPASAGLDHGWDAGLRAWVWGECMAAISRADVVFAWLDGPEAHGTIFELGATMLRLKRVVIAVPPGLSADLWFPLQVTKEVEVVDHPGITLERLAREHSLLESPAEVAFWTSHCRRREPALEGLVPAHKVMGGRYRIDFALPEQRFGIEVDGLAWHGSQDAFVRDRARQRELEAEGWRLVRFAAKEVLDKPGRCVTESARLAAQRSPAVES